MREDAEAGGAVWWRDDDDRLTRVGGVLRRTHLDELPQLLNVLRGEMSLVGPRPERPEFIKQLVDAVPYYDSRALVQPGVTGWAQIRCGYAGTDIGTAWKICHDLFYVKKRSFLFDLLLIVETVRTLVADRQFGLRPPAAEFLMGFHQAPRRRQTR